MYRRIYYMQQKNNSEYSNNNIVQIDFEVYKHI